MCILELVVGGGLMVEGQTCGMFLDGVPFDSSGGVEGGLALHMPTVWHDEDGGGDLVGR